MTMQLKAGVVVGIPFRARKEGTTHGLVVPEWAVTLANLVWPMNTTVAWAPVKGLPRDTARNNIAEETLRLGAPYLWFIDDDVQVPPDAARHLLTTIKQAPDDVMVVGGIYCGKLDPPEPLVYVGGNGTGAHWKWKRGDIFECSGIATGCMLIKTEVFKHIEKPWFRDVDGETEGWNVEHKAPTAYLNMTDDLWFCEKIQAAGFKILADTRVLCSHWDVENDKVFDLPADSYPMKPRDRVMPVCAPEGTVTALDIDAELAAAKKMRIIHDDEAHKAIARCGD